jgi:Tol biopolymer transport system component
MTTRDSLERFERDLPDLLTELAAPHIPDYVNDLFTRTVATRQRPRWTLLERWFPMGVLARRVPLAPSLPLRPIVVALLVIAALVAVLIAGRSHQLPPPFGIAANGAIAFDRGGDIYVRDTFTSEPRLAVGGPTNDFAPGFLRNGTKLTFLRTIQEQAPGKAELLAPVIADLDGSHQVVLTAGLDSPDWGDPSPDDSTFVIQAEDGGVPSLFIFDTAGTGTLRKLEIGMPAFTPSFRGPDGREIVFRGWLRTNGAGPRATVFSIRPDGSGLRQLLPINGDISGDFEYPQLSPDGRLVTYSRGDVEGFWRIHVLDLETGMEHEFQVLGQPPASHGYATFSPDGRMLLFHYISEGGLVQPMIAPVDETGPALPIGPARPAVDGNAQLSQVWSPDGRSIIVNHGRTQETRIVDAATGGDGTVIPWGQGSFGSWQRLAP